ncbi:ABC transporter substrate-binding protein [Amycolatopsis taiwanensis]|uniref:Sugar ABC transporter substrate-binding protein n=1 Tax=Amycolatopsis taiwanensis TaxID=342230 RepID=A0A9W6R7P2_9PSEU|nr:extracellular solute-binding protein [Amycolatopsis taiwanensis]GLY70636.1 sugar ABC transporter substrate-binding protein [Amycolatopsis taiwanensis]
MRSDPTLRPARWWRALVASLALLLTLSGCISGTNAGGGSDQPDSTKLGGEVEWWTINLKANYGEYVQGLIDRYQAGHPGTKINWVDVPGNDLATKLLAALSSGNPPDLVNINSKDLGRFQNSVADLHKYFTAEELAAYQPSLVKPLERDGALTALPWYNGGSPVAIYRKSALAGTSFDAQNPPKTIDDFLQLATEVKQKSGVAGMNLYEWSQVLPYYGVDMLNPQRTAAAFNTPKTIDILNRWKAAYDSGAIAPGVVSKDIRNLPENIENRRIGFVANVPATQLVNTQKNAPEVYGDLVVTPSARTPNGKLLLAAQQTFAIPNGSDNKATAADWLKFVTNNENQLAFCKVVAIFPSTKATLEDPYFAVKGTDASAVARKIIVDTLPDLADGALGTPKDQQLRDLFDEQIRAFLQGAVDAKTALGNAEQQWNQELAK